MAKDLNYFFERIFLFLYAALFFLTPLIMYHKTSELFEFNKMLFIYLITFFVLSFWLAKIILYRKIIIKKTVFDIPILLFLFSQILSTIFSIDRHTSIFGYYGRFNGGLLSIISYIILFYGFVSNIDGRDAINRVSTLLKISLISSIIVIFWGLPGKFGYDLTCYLFTGALNNNCWTEQFKPHERMFSTLGQPNWLGAYLVINFFIGLYFFVGKNYFTKYFIFYFLYLILNFSAILFTRSRSALLAVVVGLIALPVFLVFCKDAINRVSTQVKFILIKQYAILILLLLIPLFLFKTGIPKIDKFLDPTFYLNKIPISNFQFPNKYPITNYQLPITLPGVTESGEIRKIVWQGAIDLGLKYPLFGTGVETFAYSYYFVRPKEHNLTSEWDFIYNKAHNEYLNYLATTGFTGLGLYLLMIGTFCLLFFKKITNFKFLISNQIPNSKSQIPNKFLISNNGLLITCLLLAYLSILITNFFGFSTTTINLYFYLIPAFFVAPLFIPSNSGKNSSF